MCFFFEIERLFHQMWVNNFGYGDWLRLPGNGLDQPPSAVCSLLRFGFVSVQKAIIHHKLIFWNFKWIIIKTFLLE
jgi:hypothetical protein